MTPKSLIFDGFFEKTVADFVTDFVIHYVPDFFDFFVFQVGGKSFGVTFAVSMTGIRHDPKLKYRDLYVKRSCIAFPIVCPTFSHLRIS